MTSDREVVIEVIGEGPTDIGSVAMNPPVQRPTEGVVPILLHKLCGKPDRLRVKPKGQIHLQGKSLSQKVRFAKRQAWYNPSTHAVVFVLDSEGDRRQLQKRRGELAAGRDHELPDFPMAVGVAHPCIESWLLTDAAAIRHALDLERSPTVPDRPEELPAYCVDRKNNPKTELGKLSAAAHRELSVAEKNKIAQAMNDMGQVRSKCPQGFAPFADEVQERIHPLFQA